MNIANKLTQLRRWAIIKLADKTGIIANVSDFNFFMPHSLILINTHKELKEKGSITWGLKYTLIKLLIGNNVVITNVTIIFYGELVLDGFFIIHNAEVKITDKGRILNKSTKPTFTGTFEY